VRRDRFDRARVWRASGHEDVGKLVIEAAIAAVPRQAFYHAVNHLAAGRSGRSKHTLLIGQRALDDGALVAGIRGSDLR